jgi:hypothetical protein
MDYQTVTVKNNLYTLTPIDNRGEISLVVGFGNTTNIPIDQRPMNEDVEKLVGFPVRFAGMGQYTFYWIKKG